MEYWNDVKEKKTEISCPLVPRSGRQVLHPIFHCSNIPRLPTPDTGYGFNASVRGNLPAIATHAGIVAAPCTWRWQAGGGQALFHRNARNTLLLNGL